MIPVIIDTELETMSSKTHNFIYDNIFWWTYGNGNCDCNRILCFDNHNEEENKLEQKYPGICFGEKRFVVVDIIDNTGYFKDNNINIQETVKEMNQDYPEDVVQKGFEIYNKLNK